MTDRGRRQPPPERRAAEHGAVKPALTRVTGKPRPAGAGGSFDDWLHRRGDAELAALLAARPDLMTPVPADLGALAARACRRLSLDRALDDLDQFALHVIATLPVLTPPVPAGRLAAALGVSPGVLRPVLAALSARALAWQAGGGWWPAPGLPAAAGGPTWPASRAPVAPEPPPLDEIPDGGCGARRPAQAARSDRATPVDQHTAAPAGGSRRHPPLAGNGGAAPARGSRRDAATGTPGPEDGRDADQEAAGAVLTTVRRTRELIDRWAAAPPPVLRSGGLGVRELRKAAAALGADPATAALFAEVARAAGLVAASGWADGEWLPCAAYDAWRDAGPADQWAALATAWLTTTRVPGLVGTRDEGGRALGALGPGLDRMDAPLARVRVLRELADARPGAAPPAAALLARLRWRWPRWLREEQVMLAEMALREAAILGLTGHGALTSHGRALVRGGPVRAGPALAAILPEPVRHVLLQADLTAVAPGPLAGPLERELSLAADVESTGGAVVYRFSAASVRRALDAGRGSADLLATLTECSATGVPQALRYLIEDIARRHGRVRVGAAAAYVRCDDPGLLAEIAADRRAAPLKLRLLAPTVAVSRLHRGDVLAGLRRLGYGPAAEAADGTVEIAGPAPRRAAGHPAGYRAWPGGPAGPADSPWTREERVRAAVRALRGIPGEAGPPGGRHIRDPARADGASC